MITIEIRPATSERLPVLAEVVGQAFRNDPMILWPLQGDAVDLPERIARFFAAIYRPHMRDGTFWEAGDALGFANWVPPGAAGDALGTDHELAAILNGIAEAAARYNVLWAWIEARVPDDVWYLDMVGVDPVHQGRGVGSALIRHGLELAAAEGADAFLETSLSGNVAYYERLGFRVVEEGEPALGGPHIWFMRRRG